MLSYRASTLRQGLKPMTNYPCKECGKDSFVRTKDGILCLACYRLDLERLKQIVKEMSDESKKAQEEPVS